MPQIPILEPHLFLQGFLGAWIGESDVYPASGGETIEMEGSTVFSAVGSWVVGNGTVQLGETTLKAMFSIGYDPQANRFYATWIDSIYPYVWNYEGQLDETGKILTLECEGPSKFAPNERAHYREVLTFAGPDRRLHSSYVSIDGEEWKQIVAAAGRRR